jgi:hypothetical protein
MTNSEWVELVQIIPAEQHNTLMLVTTSGVNLGIELVIRTEPSYLVFRGRVCGNTDEGRVFFLPYSHIDYVNINRIVKEEEIRDMYEKHEAAKAERIAASAAECDGAGYSDAGADGGRALAPAREPLAAAATDSKVMPPRVRPLSGTMIPGTGTQRSANAPVAAPAGNDTPTPSAARTSILDRLRAQRNGLSGRPNGR